MCLEVLQLTDHHMTSRLANRKISGTGPAARMCQSCTRWPQCWSRSPSCPLQTMTRAALGRRQSSPAYAATAAHQPDGLQPAARSEQSLQRCPDHCRFLLSALRPPQLRRVLHQRGSARAPQYRHAAQPPPLQRLQAAECWLLWMAGPACVQSVSPQVHCRQMEPQRGWVRASQSGGVSRLRISATLQRRRTHRQSMG